MRARHISATSIAQAENNCHLSIFPKDTCIQKTRRVCTYAKAELRIFQKEKFLNFYVEKFQNFVVQMQMTPMCSVLAINQVYVKFQIVLACCLSDMCVMVKISARIDRMNATLTAAIHFNATMAALASAATKSTTKF